MPARRRLTLDARREQLLDHGEQLFARMPFEDVLMEDVAAGAGVSRALLYRHFPSKGALFAAIYRRAADRLLAVSRLDADAPLEPQIVAALDAHIDYFVENRFAVLAANRSLTGDPVIQAIISDELSVLRERLLDALAVEGDRREVVSAVVMSWLLFVRTLTVDWLAGGSWSREELRDVSHGALLGALGALRVTPG